MDKTLRKLADKRIEQLKINIASIDEMIADRTRSHKGSIDRLEAERLPYKTELDDLLEVLGEVSYEG